MPYKNHKQYRLPGYDYSGMGDYFITVCTNNRVHHLGIIIETDGEVLMQLSPIGTYINECIPEISAIYLGVTLGENIVIPNHIHLIIHLPHKDKIEVKQSALQELAAPHKGLQPLVPDSVSSIINHLKGKVKKWCNANGYPHFKWQSRFHDHIIRNSKSYNRISNYIANNIWTWNDDENNQLGNNFRKYIRT